MDYLNLYRELETAADHWTPASTVDRMTFAVCAVCDSALRLRMACELTDTVGPYAEQYRDAALAIREEEASHA